MVASASPDPAQPMPNINWVEERVFRPVRGRKRFAAIGAGEREDAAKRVQARLVRSKSSNTWNNYACVWRQARDYARDRLGEELSEESVLLWLEEEIQLYVQTKGERGLSKASALTYTKAILSLRLRLTTIRDWTATHDFQQALRKGGAMIPTRRAPPLPKDLAYEVMGHLRNVKEYWGFWVAWKTASRIDDVTVLVGASFVRPPLIPGTDPTRQVAVRFMCEERLRATEGEWALKAQSSVPYVIIVEATPQEIASLWTYVGGLVPTEAFTDLTTGRAETLLKELAPLAPDGGPYGAHSLKRGAGQLLQRLTIDPTLGLDATHLGFVLKHQDPGRDLPRVTAGYLDPMILAYQMRTEHFTRHL